MHSATANSYKMNVHVRIINWDKDNDTF